MAVIGTLRDAWARLRNRLLADPRFQQAAAGFPLTRPISRARSRQLFDILAGFTYSQVLYTCIRIGLIDMLAVRPLTTSAIAARAGWPEHRMARLLKAATALDLIETTSTGAHTLGIHGAALAGNPWIARFVEHHHLLYADLAYPLPLLRGEATRTSLQEFWGYAQSDAPQSLESTAASAYTSLMAASQQAVAAEILASFDFRSHHHLVDVGGGNGSFIAAVAARHPHLSFTLFDLPAVADIARQRFGRDGLNPRAEVREGSFLSDELPAGADVMSLVRVIHDHDDDSVITLLKAIRRALPPGGRLIVAEPLSGHRKTAPVADAYFGLYFAAMGQGRTRTPSEIGALGKASGFSAWRQQPTRMPLITGMVVLDA